MTQEAHTPEPWHVKAWSRQEAQIIANDNVHVTGYSLNSDARRIVACVNALAGIPIEAIESGVVAEPVRCARVISDGRYTSSDLFYLETALAKLEASK